MLELPKYQCICRIVEHSNRSDVSSPAIKRDEVNDFEIHISRPVRLVKLKRIRFSPKLFTSLFCVLHQIEILLELFISFSPNL